jgi:hypothetical protein
MPDAGQRAVIAIPTYYLKNETKTASQKVPL